MQKPHPTEASSYYYIAPATSCNPLREDSV